jgi:hypothetical protein
MKCSDFLEMDLLWRSLGGLARIGQHRVTSSKYYGSIVKLSLCTIDMAVFVYSHLFGNSTCIS